MKPSKYWQFGELAKTMETIEQFTDNEFHFQKEERGDKEFDDEEFNDKEKAQTINTSGFKRFLGLKSTWLIKYTDEKYAPHEMLHVVDSISTYQQKSLKKSFRPILTKYTETYKQYPLAKDIAYHTQANEVFARLMNQWLYENQIIETEPLLESAGDNFAKHYYQNEKKEIDKYFNKEFDKVLLKLAINEIDNIEPKNGLTL